MKEVKNILLVGVGGQGTILASKILTSGLMKAGYDVKMSEIHGMSQRGGSVSTQVRYGEKVYSPIVGKGSADVFVAFEEMEALRWLDHLKIGGTMVINDYKIQPVPVNLGMAEYPDPLAGGSYQNINNVKLPPHLEKTYDKFREWNGSRFTVSEFLYITRMNNRADALANQGMDPLR